MPHANYEVELSLRSLELVRYDFTLDDTTNLTRLDRTLHTSLDKFGFFAVTCSIESLTKIIEKVREENTEWLRRDNKVQRYYRGFDLSDPPFVDAQYEMVLLHPEHFLPH
ncbi:hypothetical protein M413DRAFT_261488 [Hebeloma cylindrosporum]|uniref:Uncharacterized protein n=1 Tax=Hebeloma cylindrosporum TaxID=76867 RepID=A0A0C2YA74_HEBCY|nr:hypothetical protein M413DRAFT_261488 [Hebeloma cylindrosporum h7]